MDAKTQRATYLTDWPQCQYSQAVGRYVDAWAWQGLRRPRRRLIVATEVEHIWNRHGAASEHPSNYASVCRPLHQWKHANSVVARIAITHFKWELAKKSGDESHFDRQALRHIAGRDVLGWIEAKLATDVLPDWCAEKAMDILEGF